MVVTEPVRFRGDAAAVFVERALQAAGLCHYQALISAYAGLNRMHGITPMYNMVSTTRLRVEGCEISLPSLDDLKGPGAQRRGGGGWRRQRLLRAKPERAVQERREARRQQPAKGLRARKELVGQLQGEQPGLQQGRDAFMSADV